MAHPGNIVNHRIEVLAGSEITADIADFSLESEQYYMHVDPAVHVLATTTFDGTHDFWTKDVIMPVSWIKMYGEGKVFYCSIGHTNADFDTKEAALLVRQGLVWATR